MQFVGDLRSRGEGGVGANPYRAYDDPDSSAAWFEGKPDGRIHRDVTGLATAGPLAGRRLRPIVSDQQFWFAPAAFLPDARIVGDQRGSGASAVK